MTGLRNLVLFGLAFLVASLALTVDARLAQAHGERTQEPSFRMRTLQWYDVAWSKTEVGVNEEWELSAKVYMMKDWPESVARPDLVFLNLMAPGPVFARTESYLNGIPARQSIKNLTLGKVYDYKVKLVGRIPGRWHVHPEIAVHTAGPLVGPGEWIEVTGSAGDFALPIETMTGNKIENLATFGVLNIGMWHIIWVLLGAGWLLYWLLRPLLIPRMILVLEGREDLLIRRVDVVAGAMLVVVSLVLILVSYRLGVDQYPDRVPLQVTVNEVPTIKQPPMDVDINLKRATYDIPGRSMRISFEATNTGNTSLTLGEFTTSSLRFVNKASPQAMARVDATYPRQWVPEGGLLVDNASPLYPGETRTFNVEATDVAWELERLTSFLTDVDARFGALFFFYESNGTRHLAEISGPILPVFKNIDSMAGNKAGVETAAVRR